MPPLRFVAEVTHGREDALSAIEEVITDFEGSMELSDFAMPETQANNTFVYLECEHDGIEMARRLSAIDGVVSVSPEPDAEPA